MASFVPTATSTQRLPAASIHSLEEGEILSSSPLPTKIGRNMDELDSLLSLTRGPRLDGVLDQAWPQIIPPSSSAEFNVTVEIVRSPSQPTLWRHAQVHPSSTSAMTAAVFPSPSGSSSEVQQPSREAGWRSVLLPQLTATPQSISGSSSEAQHSSQLAPGAQSTEQSPQTPSSAPAEYDSGSSSDSDRPLRSAHKRCRLQIKPLSSPDAGPTSQSTRPRLITPSSSAPNSRATVAVKSESGQVGSAASPDQLMTKPLSGEQKSQLGKDDSEWVDECDNCKAVGKVCFTAATSPASAKSFYNCNIRHWTCTIGGVRVNQKRPAKPKATKEVKPATEVKSSPESSSDAIVKDNKSVQSDRKLGKIRLRKSQRFVKQAEHLPVVLSTASQPPQQGRPKRIRKSRAKKTENTAAKSTAAAEDKSELSSPPPSDTERLPDASSDKVPVQAKKRAKAASVTTRKAAKTAPQQALNDTVEQRATSTQHAKEGASTSTLPLPSTDDAKEPAAQCTPSAHVEQYTTGLNKDISATLRRCKARVAQSTDFHTGLVILEMTLQVLVGNLAKVLTPENTLLNGSSPTHWILPQLKEYLQSILLACQKASEKPDGKELEEAEKQARQVAAIVASETLFDRCLTLISMHVGEEAT
ncbi:uncharacterized protein SPSC_04124 [Sporisorium scitamineum]|uniref:Uncharacterized protein n=1 Tax=Sporisorium scitamineum TaxID=49012 RepID=A0A0F7RSM0_9BASI|nr:uncharacterized protein SPSC_04124 [Sporisorium scitamineum]CDR99571.1 hypothetical protein [Sporisorium scitamineum]